MNSSISLLLEQSIQSFKIANFKKTKSLLLKVLELQSNNFDAIHLLGVLSGIEGNHHKAFNYFKVATKIKPKNHFAHFNLAKALSKLGNDTEAIEHYSISIKLKSDYAEAWNNKGVSISNLKRYEESLSYYDQAIKLKPDYAEAWNNKGVSLNNLKRYEESLSYFDQAIKLKPDYAEAWNNKGFSLKNLKRYEESLSYYDQAIKLKPEYAEAWNNKGFSLSNLKRYEESLSYYDQAIKLKPDYAHAWNNKGVSISLKHLKRYEESLSYYDQAIKLKPDYAEAWNNKGVSLKNLKRYEESLSYFDQAIKLKPDYAEAWSNKGVSLKNLKRYEESLSYYDQAIKLKPDYTEAWYCKAEIKLLLADFQDGWNLYMFRWKREDSERYRYPQFKELESTNNLDNKKILVWHEQGFGDIIQFSRYIPKLINLGAIITFEVPKDLTSFFKKQFDCEVTDHVSTNQLFDYQTPLLNLPFLFKTLINTIPLNQSYLKVQEKIIDWKEKLKLSKTKLNVGIAISGNSNYADNHIRSIPLEKMKSLFRQANFFIIQKELDTKDKIFLKDSTDIKFLGDDINNFLDTAAIVENMDLIISINTSLIHLAGALGKKSFLLLPWASEWRWLIDRSDSPWYKSIKIFRQKFIDDWDSVINEIQFELSKLKLKYY
jgi:tetratricopeptide (TPR) repeat protein